MSYPLTRANDFVTDFNYFCSTVTSCGECCFKCKDDLIKAYIDFRTAAQLEGGRLVGVRELVQRGLPNILLPHKYVSVETNPRRTLRDFVGDKYGDTHDNFIMDSERTTDRNAVYWKINWLQAKDHGVADWQWRKEVCKTWLEDFNTLDSFTEEGAHIGHLRSRLWVACFGRYTLQDLAQRRSFSEYLSEYCLNLTSRPAKETAGCLCLDRDWKTSGIAISDETILGALIRDGKLNVEDEKTRAIYLALQYVDEPILDVLLPHYSEKYDPVHLGELDPSVLERFRQLLLCPPVIQDLKGLLGQGVANRNAATRAIDTDMRRLMRLEADLWNNAF